MHGFSLVKKRALIVSLNPISYKIPISRIMIFLYAVHISIPIISCDDSMLKYSIIISSFRNVINSRHNYIPAYIAYVQLYRQNLI
jgi:hypothetical protein